MTNESEGMEIKEQDALKESYTFQYSKEEVSEITKQAHQGMQKKIVHNMVISVILLAFCIIAQMPAFLLVVFMGIFIIRNMKWIKVYVSSKESWKQAEDLVSQSIYKYKIYNNYIEACIHRNQEIASEFKFNFSEIQGIQDTGEYFLIRVLDKTNIVRKKDLNADSVIYLLYKNFCFKSIPQAATGKWRVLSLVTFIGSILSIFAALICVGKLSFLNNMFVENTWVFFLFVPIPIASIVVGNKLKRQGYAYKKNINVGIIMAILLCLYGSFSIIFSGYYSHDDEYILKVEEYTKIDIPEAKQINTQDFKKGQPGSSGRVYYISEVYFEENQVEKFEKQIKTEEKWLSAVPNQLVGTLYFAASYQVYDYVLIYNIDCQEYNTLPSDSGTYHFINIYYSATRDEMEIVEYDLDYIK